MDGELYAVLILKKVEVLYPVSEAFMQAIESNTRISSWSGTITAKNKTTYDITNEDSVNVTGYTTR